MSNRTPAGANPLNGPRQAVDRVAPTAAEQRDPPPANPAYQMDILAQGLDVVFCGLNPAASAAASGRNFSHPTNRFWSVLHRAGFTDIRLEPRHERRLLEFRCGLSAVVARPTRRAAEVSSTEFADARMGFEAKMRHHAPRCLAFLGKRALSIILDDDKLSWGRQPIAFAGMMTWLLPNPSGLNHNFSLNDLVAFYAALRQEITATNTVDR